ncbi:4Fe-4S binding protein [Spirochaeta isovalerica]|uniref:Polyferredoxin n=1 Tax=Spirochaeta isovalerica TaxID=150 RepID=A0A841R552_9SPIO|nr:4Fe-4S binding protein [Spirochaeta isovalerica]MBB6478946.1 polyferredoxin [Spirochaeta isovalerica]
MKKTTLFRLSRWGILLSILVLTTVMGRLHQMIKLYPSTDAFCPFGGLETFWALLRYNSLIRKVALSSVILLAVSTGTALLFRRSFCGNLCPLGFIQELFGSAGKSFFNRKFSLPPLIDKILRYLKYVVLVLVLALSWQTFSLVIQPYDPWLAYHHIGTEDLFSKYLVGTIILFASLGLGIFIERPFCRYLCPMGGFLGLISKIGFIRIRRNTETCIDCGICDISCPVDISISTAEQVATAECLTCSACINRCPVENTLFYSLPGKKKRKVSTAFVLFGTVALFTAVIAYATVTKQFIWKADTGLEWKVERLLAGPDRIKGDNQPVHIIQIYQIPPSYLQDQFSLLTEEDFYKTFDELGIEPSDVGDYVSMLYEQAGMDPTKLLGGNGGGRGHGRNSHEEDDH